MPNMVAVVVHLGVGKMVAMVETIVVGVHYLGLVVEEGVVALLMATVEKVAIGVPIPKGLDTLL
jgi:hypothetical protein